MACIAYGGHLCVVQQRSDVSIPVVELSFRHQSQRSAEIDSLNIADQLELNTQPPTADVDGDAGVTKRNETSLGFAYEDT